LEHDKLRADLPESAECVKDCPFCADNREKASKEEKVSENAKVYDQETLDALLEAAVRKAAEEAKKESEADLAKAQASLTEKDDELKKANTRIEELEGNVKERDEKERLEKVADERATKVAEVTDFTEEQISERKAGWAELDDEAFDTLLADFQAVTESAKLKSDDDGKPKPKGKVEPPKTALDGTRETAGKDGTDSESMRSFLAGLAS